MLGTTGVNNDRIEFMGKYHVGAELCSRTLTYGPGLDGGQGGTPSYIYENDCLLRGGQPPSVALFISLSPNNIADTFSVLT